jgi:hypothetical protein
LKACDAGSPTDAIQITSLDVSPDPPKPGQKLTITASGVARQLIDEGAYADVIVGPLNCSYSGLTRCDRSSWD